MTALPPRSRPNSSRSISNTHKHDPAKVDFIVACYSKNDEVEGVPVKAVHKLSSFDFEPQEFLPPDGELTEDEARLLSAIHCSGGLSITALSQGELAGDRQIWKRLPPDVIGAIPRGTIAESVFNIVEWYAWSGRGNASCTRG